MRVIIRTDASLQIGSGHVMRCLTLAQRLRESEVEVSFICRELEGDFCDVICRSGFTVHRLPFSGERIAASGQRLRHGHWLGVDWELDMRQTREVVSRGTTQADWIVVDHYALDVQWETAMRSVCDNVMIIDDLGDRVHDCDLLVDQNYYEYSSTRYDGLVPGDCRLLLGPKYALVRHEFAVARRKTRPRTGSVNRILVFFGGIDAMNQTEVALEAIRLLGVPGLSVDVVVGGANPHRQRLEELCHRMPTTRLHCQIDNMAELMARADLAVGGGGTTTWERCCLGLPSVVVAIADNQVESANLLGRDGLVRFLGVCDEVSSKRIFQEIVLLGSQPARLAEMSCMGMQLVDGKGSQRVVECVLERLPEGCIQ